jgi:hypothetical protein
MHTASEQNQAPQTETPKRYQCRHIFTDGHRCGSPCLRGEDLCYYHHTTRRPAQNPRTRRSRRTTFELPLPEDRSAIQHSIGQVLQRIAANDIDPRRAGLLLYGLQIASLNLPRQQPATKSEPQTVEEITTDPELGLLAPPAEVGKTTERKSTVTLLIEKMLQEDQDARQESVARKPAEQPGAHLEEQPIIPTLQATEDEARPTSVLDIIPACTRHRLESSLSERPLMRTWSLTFWTQKNAKSSPRPSLLSVNHGPPPEE